MTKARNQITITIHHILTLQYRPPVLERPEGFARQKPQVRTRIPVFRENIMYYYNNLEDYLNH